MQEWKIKQEIYHRLHTDHSDDLNSVDIVITEKIVDDAVKHFYERVDQWVYPAKSYFVAICYAHWISIDFNEDFFQLLRDPLLLAGNDPYFVVYDQDKKTYDQILEKIDFPLPMTGMTPDVRQYYDAEIGYE
jgi:hypothetical protein